jgi:hypothetical protein
MPKPPNTNGKITNREDLIKALRFASELEHMLSCEYLFASFSARKNLADFEPGGDEARQRVTLDRVRPWISQVNMIARQEMEHLGIATNLLSALGAGPWFEHPPFPLPAHAALVGAPLCLERFGESSVRRFIWYERPSYLTPSFPATPCGGVSLERKHVPHPAEVALGITSIQELYDEISTAFTSLPPAEVFQGNTDLQMGAANFGFRVEMMTVTNQLEATAAIQKILEQGEGIGDQPLHSDSHFQRFTSILEGLEASAAEMPGFSPALPVVSNPALKPHPNGLPVSVITDPAAVQVMRFFNRTYHTMLVLLKAYFATYSSTGTPEPRPQAALFYAAFFPLMTMMVRPLGEIVARMPAGADYPGQNAGVTFEVEGPVESEYEPAWFNKRLGELAATARRLHGVVPARLQPDMQSLHENMTSTQLHFQKLWTQGQ